MSAWLTPDGRTMTNRVLSRHATEAAADAAALRLGGSLISQRMSGVRYRTPDGRNLRVEFNPIFSLYELLEACEVTR